MNTTIILATLLLFVSCSSSGTKKQTDLSEKFVGSIDRR